MAWTDSFWRIRRTRGSLRNSSSVSTQVQTFDERWVHARRRPRDATPGNVTPKRWGKFSRDFCEKRDAMCPRRAGNLDADMNAYSPKKYWGELAENYVSADAEGLAPVLHPGAPAWFNRLIDKQQFQAVRHALTLARIPAAARSLDVGCGTGRWVRRYGQLGFRATGLDVTPGMLKTAQKCGTTGPLVAGEAHGLP